MKQAKKTARRDDMEKYGRLLRVTSAKTIQIRMYERATVFVPLTGCLAVAQHTSSSELPHVLRLDHIP